MSPSVLISVYSIISDSLLLSLWMSWSVDIFNKWVIVTVPCETVVEIRERIAIPLELV